MAVVYIGELIFRSVPFSQCASKVRLEADVSGQNIFSNCKNMFYINFMPFSDWLRNHSKDRSRMLKVSINDFKNRKFG